MNTKDLQTLLLRYRQGNCTEEEIEQIHKWYESLNAGSSIALTDDDRQALEEKLLKNIREEVMEPRFMEEPVPLNASWRFSSVFYSGVAAAVILTLSFLLFFNKKEVVRTLANSEPILVKISTGKLITTENKTKEAKIITLDDKSVIELCPGSRIIYPDKFPGDKREVQLTGNAFFKVTKDPHRPFSVFSGNLVTKVLGTSFRIITKAGDNAVEVEVVTGKVSVFENIHTTVTKEPSGKLHKPNNGVVLTPNQRVTYFTESGHLMTSLVEKPVAIAAAVVAPKVVYNNELLTDIMAQLQSEYGIEIVLSSDHLEKCSFTGDVSDMSLYDKLDLICKSNMATYEVKGTRILIDGEGCDAK
ncbi:FecR family protein [Dyadobacter pollutisoli]|uniref:FecR family protein n=1 Tax=Dyadobacter pollutisoli TaxID=2910158 RepID=A0A9E8N6U2_9BACT|nr:FecR family protein [Dyadobacter pollutisoli]WAC10900.1 FecR family protein [Dyadobacter pollutisoli]